LCLSDWVQDDGGSAHDGFFNSSLHVMHIHVAAVNTAPSFALLFSEALVCHDFPRFNDTVASNMSAGPLEFQKLTFHMQLVSGEASLFKELPQFDGNGRLTFEISTSRSPPQISFETLDAVFVESSCSDTWCRACSEKCGSADDKLCMYQCQFPNASSGKAIFNLTLFDNGGTARGGINRSYSAMFSVTVEDFLTHSLSTVLYTLDEDDATGHVQLLVCSFDSVFVICKFTSFEWVCMYVCACIDSQTDRDRKGET